MKNPGVFSSRVLLDSLRMFCYTRSPIGPWLPGMLFAGVKPRDQACVWRHIADFNSEWVAVFILSPIVLYLPFEINLERFLCGIYTTCLKLVAVEGIEPPTYRLWACPDTASNTLRHYLSIVKHTISSSRALFGMRLILTNPLQYALR